MILEFPDNALIILCGPAGSGKSYFAEKFFKETQIVSSDRCRELLCDDAHDQGVSPDAFELFYRIISGRVKYNRLTVADATNLSVPYRNTLRRIAARHDRPAYLVVFATDLAQCLKNNASRDRQVERNVIETQMARLYSSLENIPAEAYAKVYRITSQQVNDLEVRIVRAAGPMEERTGERR